MSSQTKLNDIAQQFELPGQIVRLFGELQEMSPEIARHLLDQLGTVVRSGNGSVSARRRGKATRSKYTQFERLAMIFADTDNKSMTKVQMAEAAGISDNSLHSIIYTSHKSSLRKINDPDGGRAKLYQLTPEALEEAKGGHDASH